MTRLLLAFTTTAALSLGFVAEAGAWTRHGTVTGPRGTATIDGSGSCYNGSCSRQVTRTGPYGNSVSRQGSVSCAGGACSASRTTTGPRGATVTRQGTIRR
ncbi:hypothetical protein [Jiella sonneratiae]|uniref:Uncharacterized protein n=1 Tax=Jiella sonneratiae TaxID=2816856 RepID=A0ABS3J8T8_9HYPH|nr:hypothetical protein [Jiella sonneratiae]MBO0906080.1 hypothetical protein [Jiella sonneratiae]